MTHTCSLSRRTLFLAQLSKTTQSGIWYFSDIDVLWDADVDPKLSFRNI